MLLRMLGRCCASVPLEPEWLVDILGKHERFKFSADGAQLVHSSHSQQTPAADTDSPLSFTCES